MTHHFYIIECTITKYLFQEKVYEELQFIFGSSDRCPEYNDLQEMKYLEQTIKETLRYYTVAPVIGRTFNEDFVLS